MFIAMTNTGAKLIGADASAINVVADALSYDDDSAQRKTGFNVGNLNSRKTFLRLKELVFEAGFVQLVKQRLGESGYAVTVKDMRTDLDARGPAIDLSAPTGSELCDDGIEYPTYGGYLDGIDLRDYQAKVIEDFVVAKRGIIQAATGSGKCLGRDTPVLMFDGSIKMVQDVVVGDRLMGPDSQPRTVLSTTSGVSKLYRIVPTKGDPYVVNDAHILSLKQTSIHNRPKGAVVNINVEEYVAKNKTFKHTHKGWRTGVDFQSTDRLPIDPYFLGVWLGDGRGGSKCPVVEITTGDAEIADCVRRVANEFGLSVRDEPNSENSRILRVVGPRGGDMATYPLSQRNPIAHALNELCLFNNKHIPAIYLRSSRKERLELLAGLIDTDGTYGGKCMYLTLKNERLMDDAIFLARSLGLAAYKRTVQKTCTNNGKVGTYFTTSIFGDIDSVPCRLPRKQAAPRLQKKDHLVTGIRVEDAGCGDYYGFEIDSDKLFLLGDFTVTHNTEIGAGIIKRVSRKTLWLTHKIDLVDQTRKRIKKRLGITSGLISEGEWFPSDITIATVQTIMSQMKSDPERVTAFLSSIELLIVDEAHRSSGDGFFSVITNCTGAYYRASLTATPLMKGKQEDDLRLIATSGDIICRITNSDLIRRGILAEPHFVFTQVPSFGFDERKARREAKAKAKAKGRESYGTGAIYQRAYDEGIVNNAYRNNLIVSDAKELVDKGRKTVVLFQRQEHGKLLEDIFIRAGMRVRLVHGVNDLDERNSALNDLRDGLIDVVLASNIFDEGLDEPSISGIVLAGGGKSKISLFQRVGRSVRKKTGDDLEKLGNTAEIRDYIDTGHKNLMKHSALRFHAVKSEDGWIIDQLRMV